MRRTLQLMSALALFFCGLNLNAQNEAPKVTVKNVKGAAVTIIDSQYHFPYDISDNKQHVAIQAMGEGQSFYWSETSGLVPVEGTVFAVSDDGIIAGYYTNDQGMVVSGLWYPDMQQWQFLGMNPALALVSLGDSSPTLAPFDFNSDNSKWDFKWFSK